MFHVWQDADTLRDIGDQIETLKANISYIQDNINDCQSNIMQMEESKVSARKKCVCT